MAPDDPLIALGSVVADVGLVLSFKPQPAPLCYGVVARVIEHHVPVFPNGFRQPFLCTPLGSWRTRFSGWPGR